MANHIRINGVTLPDRNVGIQGITNNVVLYVDGTYAAVRDGKVVTGQVPANGEIDIDGVKIRASGASGIHSRVSVGNIGGSISIGRGNITNHMIIDGCGIQSIVSVGGESGEPVDESYTLSSGNAIAARSVGEDLKLLLCNGVKASVNGRATQKPEYRAGQLSLEGLEGRLALPRTLALHLDISTVGGDIDGHIAHPGSVRSVGGDIDLELYAPLQVETQTVGGDVEIIGMVRTSRNTYAPVGAEARGTLRLNTVGGDISLTYKQ